MSDVAPRELVVVGDSLFAEIAHEYFEHDSPHQVVAFSVEREHRNRNRFRGLPVVPFEDLASELDPSRHSVFVALTYGQLNRVRTRLLDEASAKGFHPASYVSSRASVWPNVRLGEHCVIFEDNTLQPFVSVGRNCVLWSGNHIGHHSSIEDNVFIASHAVISGSVRIGDNCFIGVNATIVDDVTVGADSWIGPSVIVTRDVEGNSIWRAVRSERRSVSSREAFKVTE
ncbi:MAG: acetyltransferase [Actinomycetota bacterium]|nr:acetyltransferase [Actinomycetota bacterium]